MTLQFFECPNCQKNLRVGAQACHHCHAVDENDWADPDAAPEAADGGYSQEESDEYEKPITAATKWWRRTVVLVVLLLLLSFLLQTIAFFPVPHVDAP